MKTLMLKPLLFGSTILAIAGLSTAFVPAIDTATALQPSAVSAESSSKIKLLEINGYGYKKNAISGIKVIEQGTGKTVYNRSVKTDASGRHKTTLGLPAGKYSISMGVAGRSDSFSPPLSVQILEDDDEHMLFEGVSQILQIDWTYIQTSR